MKNRRLSQEIEIDIPKDSWLTKKHKIFTIGSCFALNLRKWLQRSGYDAPPISSSRDLAWYNTFSLRDEFQLAAAGTHPQEHKFHQASEDMWIDPFRNKTTAKTLGSLEEERKATDAAVIRGITEADLIVITLGLIECWLWDGEIICHTPLRGSNMRAELFVANYNTNMDNCLQLMTHLRKANPTAKVIFSVSPVPLRKTFRNIDHEIANTESKSVLRAVAGEIVDVCNNTEYFPSYEIVNAVDRQDRYERDGRHIKQALIDNVMREFEKAFVA